VIRLKLNAPAPGDNPLAQLQRRLPTALGQSLERALEDGLEAARLALGQRGTPGGRGRLADSLAQRQSGWGLSLEGELYSDLPYAGVQEFGAQIQALRANYLKFQVEGRWVQVKRVTVPARPFLAPGAEAAASALEGYLTSALMEDMP
jgi:phage gpG-like protein